MSKLELIKMILDRNARLTIINKTIVEENDKVIAENNKLIEYLKNELKTREN